MLKILMFSTALTVVPVAIGNAQEAEMRIEMGTLMFDPQSSVETMMDGDGFVTGHENQMLGFNFIGASIFTGAGEDAEAIGDVNDLLLARDGRIAGVVVGVGGFLGLGEKEVAISVDRLNIVEDSASDERIISEYTREQLENATAFQRSLLSDDDSGMWSGTSTMREDNAGMMGQADSDVEMDMAADAEANPTPETSGEMTAEAEADMEPNVDPEDTAALDDRMFMPISEAGELKASNLIGMEVQGAGGSDVGEIGDVILSSDGAVEAIIVDVGGFLGMSEKPVAVSLENLEISQADDMSGSSIIRTGLTEPQLEGHPGYDANAYAAQRGDMLMTAPAYTE